MFNKLWSYVQARSVRRMPSVAFSKQSPRIRWKPCSPCSCSVMSLNRWNTNCSYVLLDNCPLKRLIKRGISSPKRDSFPNLLTLTFMDELNGGASVNIFLHLGRLRHVNCDGLVVCLENNSPHNAPQLLTSWITPLRVSGTFSYRTNLQLLKKKDKVKLQSALNYTK